MFNHDISRIIAIAMIVTLNMNVSYSSEYLQQISSKPVSESSTIKLVTNETLRIRGGICSDEKFAKKDVYDKCALT